MGSIAGATHNQLSSKRPLLLNVTVSMPPEMPDPAIARALGDAIRSAREQAGYTQRSFADHAGVEFDEYAAIELGAHQPKLDTIVQIAAGVRLSAAELFKRAKL